MIVGVNCLPHSIRIFVATPVIHGIDEDFARLLSLSDS